LLLGLLAAAATPTTASPPPTVRLDVPIAAAADASGFPLKDGDIWVMAGDSITAQHLHSNYFEAFCYARYPQMKFAFRNSGVGGHTIPSTLARFDYDIGAWKPTVVSVELGMNDSGGTKTENFIKNMGTMTERIRKSGARPVILAASPVNDGTTSAKLAGRNQRLDEYATALKGFCATEKIPYADQFHALLDPWGKNKPRERLLSAIADLKMAATDDSLAGVEALRAFLAAQEKNPAKGVNLTGDPVHPGAPGQLMMAAALLKDLKAEGFVSSVAIDAEGGKAEGKGCAVTDVKATKDSIAFDRLDERLPFPIPDEARAVLAIAPDVLALSEYTLTVSGLKDGEYLLKIGNAPAGQFTAKQLATGINLTSLAPVPGAKDVNPIIAQMRAILKAVSDKEGVVGTWRALSQKAHAKGAEAGLMDELAALTKKVEAADAQIRQAAKPQKLHFEITLAPAK
jgi:lysophospholipase L1-like esterase